MNMAMSYYLPQYMYQIVKSLIRKHQRNITSFLADIVLKQQYDNILKTLSEKQKTLFKDISDHARSTDIIPEFVRTFCESKPSLFYSKFEEVMAEVAGSEICYNFKYNSIFDKDGKVKAFIDSNHEGLKRLFR